MLRSWHVGRRAPALLPPSASGVRRHKAWTDAAFRVVLTVFGLSVIVLVAWMMIQLLVTAMPAIQRFGPACLWEHEASAENPAAVDTLDQGQEDSGEPWSNSQTGDGVDVPWARWTPE